MLPYTFRPDSPNALNFPGQALVYLNCHTRVFHAGLRLLPRTVLCISSALCTIAHAQEDDSPWSLGVALGHGERNNPFVGSDDIRQNLVLDIAWYGERWFFDNGDFGVTLSEQPRHSLNAVLTFDNERNYYSSLSNGSSGIDILNLRALAQEQGFIGPSLVGGDKQDLESLSRAELESLVFEDVDSELPERDFAASAGLEWLSVNPWGDVQVQWLQDVSGTHHGQSAWLGWSYPWLTERSEINFSLGMEWKSGDLVNYYYGVRDSEALKGRPVYSPGSGTNGVLRLSYARKLNEHWRLVGVAEHERLSSAIRRSPVIDRGHVNTLFVGLYYQFK